MKSKFIIAALVAITASMFGATTLHSAIADPSPSATPAVVIKDNGCSMVDQNGDVTIVSDSDHSTTTSKGNTTLQCKATTPNDSGKAIKFNKDNTGLPCTTPLGLTDNWSETISKSGQATLTCTVKTPKA